MALGSGRDGKKGTRTEPLGGRVGVTGLPRIIFETAPSNVVGVERPRGRTLHYGQGKCCASLDPDALTHGSPGYNRKWHVEGWR